MPPGYANRLAEIQRLTADLQSMGRFGRLLCDVGVPLADITRELFASVGFDAELIPGEGYAGVLVKLDGHSRLLLHVSGETQTVQKKSPEVAHVFRMLQELGTEQDRVALVTNVESAKPPTERGEALAADALALVNRMGASHVTAPTLFTLWKLSLMEPDRARQQVRRLHSQDAGTFEIPASALT
jgi:hypothetical protein